jgi:methanogenic corrinoid protein MtbC1
LGKTAGLGCAANSWHLIGLRMISDVMRLRGWRTLFLGANVPTPSFLNAVDSHHAELTLISCAAEEGWTATKELVEGLAELRARGHTFSIGLGGNEAHLHEAELRALGANFLATDLRSFVRDVLPSIEASPK